MEMGQRDEIVARLRQLPEVLGKTDREIADACGISPQQWSNYKSESYTESSIRPLVALELEKAFGVPMGWVYGGLLDRINDPDLRARLALANRRADAWLAARDPRRGRPSARILVWMLACATLFAACTSAGHAWKRIDNAPISAQKAEADRAACRGEAVKANLSAGQEAALAPETFGFSRAMMAVYVGCMADRGYLPDGNWYSP